MKLSTTKDILWISEYNNPSSTIQIQFVPSQIEIVRESITENMTIVGRNFPFIQYSGGSRKLRFTIDFYTEKENGKDVVDEKIKRLESWLMNETFEKGLTVLQLEFGGLFSEGKWILSSLSNIVLKALDDQKSYYPRTASVEIELTQYVPTEIKRIQFLNGNF